MKIIYMCLLFFVITGCVAESNVIKNTELKERITTVLEVKNEIAYLPNENEPYTGKYEEFDPNGQKVRQLHYKDGKENGLRTDYWENGQKASEWNYTNGKLIGLHREWRQDGKLINETNFIDGQENGLKAVWSKNGQDYIKRMERNLKNGKESGLRTIWDENGNKSMETNYTDGKKNGLDTFWINGQKRGEQNYIDGEQVGTTSFWDENGQQFGGENESKQKTSEPIQEIKKRCQIQMGEHGAAIVKACVDQDIEALQALGSYLKNHEAITRRCIIQMGSKNGYTIIKACPDQDIEAEDALSKY